MNFDPFSEESFTKTIALIIQTLTLGTTNWLSDQTYMKDFQRAGLNTISLACGNL
jgi:hypothetical protein